MNFRNMSDVKYWVSFNLIPGIGTVKFSLSENHFGSLERAWHATASELRAAGLDSKTVQKIISTRPTISPDAEMKKMERHGIKAFTWNDDAYPFRLKEIYDRPPVLYVRGSLLPQDDCSIAVVGTRRATVYGRQVAEEICTELAHNGVTVISGLARGIDSVAHRATLDAGGRTVAVFGCGLDIVYPADHLRLAQRIIEQGALVSEYPPGTRPRAENFPRRNRIMSGMSLGVLVIEAGEKSGALITARLALEQNREVFAVPGSILSPMSRGTNSLIQEGAKLVRNYGDILEELNLSMVVQQPELREPTPVTDTESLLLRHISREATHIDDICRQSGLPMAVVNSMLAMMELRGIVKHMGGMNYILTKEAEHEVSAR
jgi:DNA processing protein